MTMRFASPKLEQRSATQKSGSAAGAVVDQEAMPDPIFADPRLAVRTTSWTTTGAISTSTRGWLQRTDIILVAEILGHSVETARRYALPTHEDRHAAIGRLTTDK